MGRDGRPTARTGAATSTAALVASALAALALGLGAAPRDAGAQDVPRYQPEVRVDAFVARYTAVHLGAGIVLPAGSYARLAAIAGGGTVFAHDRARGSARAELVGRFLMDPFLTTRWGAYGGAGLAARHDEGSRWRALAVAVLGVEAPPGRLGAPFVEVGVGGGGRVSLGVRRRMGDRR